MVCVIMCHGVCGVSWCVMVCVMVFVMVCFIVCVVACHGFFIDLY
jgi:hypothetical protein